MNLFFTTAHNTAYAAKLTLEFSCKERLKVLKLAQALLIIYYI